MPEQLPPENPLVRRSDLSEAKEDLRREMRYSLLVGSGVGTTLSGIIGALVARNPGQAEEVVMGALSSLPF